MQTTFQDMVCENPLTTMLISVKDWYNSEGEKTVLTNSGEKLQKEWTPCLSLQKNKTKQQIYHILQSPSTAKQKAEVAAVEHAKLTRQLDNSLCYSLSWMRWHGKTSLCLLCTFSLFFPDFHTETLFQNSVKNSPSGTPGFSVILICRSGTTGSPSALPISAGR